MNLTFKYQLLAIILVIIACQSKAQVPDEHSIQPDSVYRRNKVKRIFVYDNSPKDLGKIIEVDTNGHFTKILLYSASYDKATRARKGIEITVRYAYNSKGQLIERIDSASYVKSSAGTDCTYYYYDTAGVLKTAKYYVRQDLDTQTEYDSRPFRSTTTRRSLNDSLITYQDIEEYDRDFYKRSWWGYSWTIPSKIGIVVKGSDTTRYEYADYTDMKKFQWVEEDINRFNEKGQLISSYENQHSTSVDGWKQVQTTYFYTYYKNGLLKEGRDGYYKYEFYKSP